MWSPSIFRANDIRGIYKKDFDIHFCEDLSNAFHFLFKKTLSLSSPSLLLGFDARLSSPGLAKKLSHSLKQKGISVAFVGIAPSPLCYFLLHHYNFHAAIIVTASHNPPEYNGFKIMLHKSLKIWEPIKILKTILKNTCFSSQKTEKGQNIEIDPFGPYISSLQKEFSLKNIPCVMDFGNGALGPLAKKSFQALQIFPELLFSGAGWPFPSSPPRSHFGRKSTRT